MRTPLAALLLSIIMAHHSQAQTPPPSLKTYEIRQPTGTWQVPGKIKVPTGRWQIPGDIQVPKDIEVRSGDDGRGCEGRLGVGADALFDFDKSDLTPAAQRTLAELSELLNKLKPKSISIEGHTDGVGNDRYNEALSERRAAAVGEWLLQQGVGVSKPFLGYGERRPIAAEKNPDGSDNPRGRQRNRRVEIVVNSCE